MEPIKDKDGGVLGVIISEVVINYQNKILKENFKLGETGKIFMTTLDGQRIVNNKDEMSPPLKSQGIFNAIKKGEVIGEFVNEQGIPVIGLYFHEIDKYPWVLNVEIHRDEVFAPVERVTRVAIGVVVCVLVIMFMVSLALARKFSKPIIAAELFSKNIAEGNLSSQEKNEIFRQRPDELGSLHRSLDLMRQSLKDLIDNLDLKVKEKTRDISLILEHIPSGLITFNMGGKVGKEYSAITKEFLGVDPSDKQVEEVIYTSKGKSKEFRDVMEMLPDCPMPFEDSMMLAPTGEIMKHGDKAYDLEYSYVPIYKEGTNNEYEKIMLIAKDVTEERALEAEMKFKEHQTEFILKVLKSKEGYINFLKECNRCIKDLNDLSSKILDGKPEEVVFAAFRSAHTIKGNSSAFGIIELRDSSNDLEGVLMKGRDGEVSVDQVFSKETKKLIQALQEVFKKHIKDTESLFGEKFDPNANVQKEFTVSESKIDQILMTLQHVGDKELSLKLNHLINEIKLKPIQVFLEPFIDQVSLLAEKLEKQIHPLEIKGGDILVDTDNLRAFFAAFVHMIRNSVDHGIESVDKRSKANKSDFATISIGVSSDEKNLCIEVSDDGGGINSDVVGNLAVEKGIVTKEQLQKMETKEIQLLIFSPGFSTKQEVTNTSGRGVGMDAVKHEVENLEGSIDLESSLGMGTKFRIEIPHQQKSEPHKSEDKRIFKRKELSSYIEAFDANGDKLGYVSDLSPDGLLLLGNKEIPIGDVFYLNLSTKGIDEKLPFVRFELRARRNRVQLSDRVEIGCEFASKLSKDEEHYIRKCILYLGEE